MKARKVVTRSGRKFKGLFPSKKLQRMVEWESLLERDAILLFEFSPGVVIYQEQPQMIEYEQDGEIRKYYPDFRVILRSGEIIYFEVKPASKLRSPELTKKLGAVKSHYDRIGGDFRLLLDDKIRVEPRLSNLKRLASVQHIIIDSSIILAQVIATIENNPASSLLSLSQIYDQTKILYLVAHGYLCCDLNIDIFASDIFLRVPMETDHDALLF